jgi:hypothetical protein
MRLPGLEGNRAAAARREDVPRGLLFPLSRRSWAGKQAAAATMDQRCARATLSASPFRGAVNVGPTRFRTSTQAHLRLRFHPARGPTCLKTRAFSRARMRSDLVNLSTAGPTHPAVPGAVVLDVPDLVPALVCSGNPLSCRARRFRTGPAPGVGAGFATGSGGSPAPLRSVGFPPEPCRFPGGPGRSEISNPTHELNKLTP